MSKVVRFTKRYRRFKVGDERILTDNYANRLVRIERVAEFVNGPGTEFEVLRNIVDEEE